MYVDDQHLFIMGSVEDADPPALRRIENTEYLPVSPRRRHARSLRVISDSDIQIARAAYMRVCVFVSLAVKFP